MLDTRDRSSAGDVVAWIAVVLASAALIFSIIAYNRAGKNLETQIDEGVDNTVQEADDVSDEAEQSTQDAVDATENAIDEGPDGVDDGSQ